MHSSNLLTEEGELWKLCSDESTGGGRAQLNIYVQWVGEHGTRRGVTVLCRSHLTTDPVCIMQVTPDYRSGVYSNADIGRLMVMRHEDSSSMAQHCLLR